MPSLRCNIFKNSKLVSKVFKAYHETGPFTLRFLLLKHMVENAKKFTALDVMDSSGFERFYAQVKSAYQAASRQNASGE